MSVTETAIDNAYAAQIARLYKTLGQGFLNAKSDSTKEEKALDKFRKGLEFANGVRESARAAAGL